jgi:hypothetical protein
MPLPLCLENIQPGKSKILAFYLAVNLGLEGKLLGRVMTKPQVKQKLVKDAVGLKPRLGLLMMNGEAWGEV